MRQKIDIRISRRHFLLAGSTLAALQVMGHSRESLSQTRSDPVPDPAMLQAGDLVWPKRPFAIVLYDSTETGNRDAIKKQWEQERNAFVKSVRTNPASPMELRQIATDMETLTFEEFYAQYHTDLTSDEIQKYGAIDDVFSVGHVGIIDVTTSGEKFVIEAVWGSIKKVQRILYSDWIKGRQGSWVWAGRLRDVSLQDRARIPEQARTYIDRPYNFWNFDLGDDSSFYCSKLVWLSIIKALNVVLDNNPKTQRAFWFSPKQAWNSPLIVKLNAPREFTY